MITTFARLTMEKNYMRVGTHKELNKIFETALQIALSAHSGQTDKGGMPYILHPLAVASSFSDLKLKTIAILHDTIEDSFITPEYLIEHDIPKDIVDVVVLLTKPKDMDYKDYLVRITENQEALAVKKADISHNTSPERAGGLNEQRRAKYELAKKILSEQHNRRQNVRNSGR